MLFNIFPFRNVSFLIMCVANVTLYCSIFHHLAAKKLSNELETIKPTQMMGLGAIEIFYINLFVTV